MEPTIFGPGPITGLNTLFATPVAKRSSRPVMGVERQSRERENVALTPEIFNRLKGADWENIRPALVTHVVYRARNYGLRSGKCYAELIRGNAPQDIADEVIKRVLSGVRPWDPERGELLPYLKLQADGVLDALFDSAAARHESLAPGASSGGNHDEHSGTDDMIANAAMPVSPPEDQIHASRVIGRLFVETQSDPGAQAILTALMDGCEPKTRFLAEELKASPDDITNGLKRLRRRALAEEGK